MRRRDTGCSRGRNHQAGFSLIEAVCALLVLGVGVVGVAEGIAGALESSKQAEIHSVAALLAAGRIELLRADSFITASDDEGAFSEPFAAYKWHESVTETEVSGLYEVIVTVERESSRSPAFELRTLLFDAPLDLTGVGSQRTGRNR